MALYIPHSIFHLARLLYVRPETFGPHYVLSSLSTYYQTTCLPTISKAPVFFLTVCINVRNIISSAAWIIRWCVPHSISVLFRLLGTSREHILKQNLKTMEKTISLFQTTLKKKIITRTHVCQSAFWYTCHLSIFLNISCFIGVSKCLQVRV